MLEAEVESRGAWGEDDRSVGGIGLCVLVLIAALAARGVINFANVTPGGMDAGYYPIQARSLIETGALLYRDVPLYHWCVAGLARGLIATGWTLDVGALTASKLIDTVAPVGLGLVTLAMGWAFGRGRTRSAAALAAPVALAALSAPAIRMVSDFQKQSAAMVMLAGAVWMCRAALRRSTLGARAWAWMGVAAALGLTGLTHAGTFAAAVVTVGCVVAAYATVFTRLSAGKLGLLVAGAALAGAALFAGVYIADEGKAMGLVRGAAKLTRLSMGGGGGEGGPEGMPGPGPGGRRGPGMFGGFGAMGLAIAIAAHVVGVWTIVVARRAAAAPAADRAVAVGCAIAAMGLASPLLAPDYFMRLTLMAPAPLAVALAFVLARRAGEGRRSAPAWGVLVACVVSAAAPLAFLTRPMVNDAGIAELKAMRPVVAERTGTVVVARHGLEFWAAYFLHTPVRTAPGKADELAKFERVLVLAEEHGPMGRGPGRGGMRGPGGGRMGPGPMGPGPIGPGPMGPPQRLGPAVFKGEEFVLAERAEEGAGR